MSYLILHGIGYYYITWYEKCMRIIFDLFQIFRKGANGMLSAAAIHLIFLPRQSSPTVTEPQREVTCHLEWKVTGCWGGSRGDLFFRQPWSFPSDDSRQLIPAVISQSALPVVTTASKGDGVYFLATPPSWGSAENLFWGSYLFWRDANFFLIYGCQVWVTSNDFGGSLLAQRVGFVFPTESRVCSKMVRPFSIVGTWSCRL